METKVKFKLVFMLILAGFFIACSKKGTNEGTENEKDQPIVIGKVNIEKSGAPLLKLAMPEINAFMQRHNKFITSGLTFRYENAWITRLVNNKNEADYYLSVGCNVIDRQNKQIGDCYTIFIPLSTSGDDLLFEPPGGTQHSCTGYCCSSCQLYPADETHPSPYCVCETPSTTPSCQGEARCDHSLVHGIGSGH
jgi:hypothetical protein